MEGEKTILSQFQAFLADYGLEEATKKGGRDLLYAAFISGFTCGMKHMREAIENAIDQSSGEDKE